MFGGRPDDGNLDSLKYAMGYMRRAMRIPEREFGLVMRDVFQIGCFYADMKAEVLSRTPVRLMFNPREPLGSQMMPIESMVAPEVAHQLALIDDMCRTVTLQYLRATGGQDLVEIVELERLYNLT